MADTPGVWQAERRVNIHGIICICNTRIRVGTPLTGQTLHTIFDDTTITVIDTNGVILGTVHRLTNNHDDSVISITPRKPGRPPKTNRQRSNETQPSTK